MGTAFSPPTLTTLDTKPSWHNRAGRVDRSACFVLTASKLWRRIPDDDWTYGYPARQPAYQAKGKCDRYAERVLWAQDLWSWHKWEMPYPLQGDFRSIKSNAMRAHSPRNRSAQRVQSQRDDAILGKGPTNPNRGVGFNYHKMLGLDCMWSTTLRIERIIQHAKLKQHFFVCPVCGLRNNGSGGMGVPPVIEPQQYDGRDGHPTQARKRAYKLPAGRVTKLYLPLCTPQEYEDAKIAELWLRTHCHPNRPWPPAAVQLIERYAEMFDGQHGRQLRCRQCLGLRYGEVKAHQSMKRKRVPGIFCNQVALANASCSDKPSRLSEQSLFLTNLPKLLAKPQLAAPTAVRPAGARAACRPGPVTDDSTRLASDRGTPTIGIDAPSPEIKEQLLLALAGSMPAFKKLEKVKQMPQ